MLYLTGSVLFAAACGAALAQQVLGAAVAYGILCAVFMLAGCATYNKED